MSSERAVSITGPTDNPRPALIRQWLVQHFELSRRGGPSNLRAMEGLRGFAVFLVFLVHYVTLVQPWIDEQSVVLVLATALHTIGNTGVDLFFVLSGYLIYSSLISRPQKFTLFMSRRVQRIYPAFVPVFLAYVALSFVFPAESKIPRSLTEGIVYLAQNFLLLPGLFPIAPMITVAWSLSYEFFFYLTIPLVIVIFNLRQRSVLWRACFFSSLTAMTMIYCVAFGGHIRLTMFVAGILLHEAINSRRVAAPGSLVAFVALVAGLLATLLPVTGALGSAVKVPALFVSFFVLCLSLFGHPDAWLARAFSWTPLRWLGNMSYSYYLLHGLALKASFLAFARFFPGTEQGSVLFWAFLPVMFGLTLIPTTALFLSVERPLSLVAKGN